MKDEGDGVYSYKIPVGTKVFQSNIIVTAYDKYGKSSLSCPNIENAESMPENSLFTRMNTNYDRLSVNFARSIAIRKLLYYIFEGKW